MMKIAFMVALSFLPLAASACPLGLDAQSCQVYDRVESGMPQPRQYPEVVNQDGQEIGALQQDQHFPSGGSHSNEYLIGRNGQTLGYVQNGAGQ